MTSRNIRQRLLQSSMIGGTALMALVAAPAVTLLTPTAVVAQTQTGSLRINITGASGQPVVGATVVVSSPDSLLTKTGVTDASGFVRVSGLDPATNYTVAVDAPGYENFAASNVAVVSGRDLTVGYALRDTSDATTLADIVVTGRSLAAIDTTSATVSTTLNLQTVEALPTGRSYQSYLQLVPGVKPSSGGNPSSRSGVNYSDIGGAIGASTDNVYYLDGVDVTDPNTGTFGTNFNSEIIQEQQVIVGGVPAEYAGGSGLISRVVTKSGGNDWHGSINYYFQNDGLVQEDEHSTSGGFSTYDSAFTLGGPILRDRLWIFGSYQKKHREEDLLDSSGAALRSVETDEEYEFLKATWQVTENDRLSASYFSDPYERSGSTDTAILNNRSVARIQGGDNYKIDYSHTWNDLLVNAYWFHHEGELTNIAASDAVRDNLTFRNSDDATAFQRQLGGSGSNLETNRDRDEFGINLEYYLDTSWGSHTFKAGYSNTENTYGENGTVPGGATYVSLASQYAGTTWLDYSTSSGPVNGWTNRSVTSVDNIRVLNALNANATARAALDTNADGSVSVDELNAYQLTSTAGNPYGNVNVYRALRTVEGPYEVQSKGQTLYLQDTWTLNQLTVNAGVRAEKWEHFASDGSKVANFDWEIAPRFSVVYDLFGDGRSKVFGFAGRYYDPIRNNMSDFAGALTGPVDEEQIFLGGEWITFRTRGGATTPDALFAPNTKTPYTDEFMIGASTTFGSSIGLSASITNRKTRDILEDFDLALYSDPDATAADGAGGVAYPGSLFYLPLSYFGYSSTPNSNYVIGTLPGGERNYTGFEVTLTKYKTDNWFGQVSYTYNDAEGNSNSDSNADYQGDWIALDPRAPNVFGPQPGNIEHQFKAYGSYEFDFGLEVSGVFNWNSGALYTPAQLIGGRYFAPMDDPYEYGGVTDSYLSAGYVGSETTPDYYTFDVRFKYTYDLPIGEAEIFLDIFNVLNNQAATDVMKLISGDGVYDYQEANDWVEPRRAYLGVRYSF